MHEFRSFQKIARLNRMMTITEKLDGSNGQIFIGEDGEFLVGSRSRWITPEDDNHGFARWAYEHRDELMQMGPGEHFGEWWGLGIQRNYGLKEKRFSLFNTGRWVTHGQTPGIRSQVDPTAPPRMQEVLPACCGLVPILYHGKFDTAVIDNVVEALREKGSVAVPGFMKPEGVIVYHHAMNGFFKVTLVKDEEPKGKSR